MQVTTAEVQEAKSKSLYEYMLSNYPDMVRKQGRSLRLESNPSISITENFFTDFAGIDKGDNISFLQKYLNLSFQESVLALIGSRAAAVNNQSNGSQFALPRRATDNNRIINYLTIERGIDKRLVSWLIGKGVLYQDDYSNCVFISPKKSFYEVRGIYDKPFHKNADLSPNNTNYWYMNNPSARVLRKAYICESCIDCISLYLLRPDEAYYMAIAGVGNQQRIDAIKKLGLETITAFDNDLAGQQGRNRNNDIKHIIPDDGFKDWNEQLRKGKL